jgi:hypothetical protein
MSEETSKLTLKSLKAQLDQLEENLADLQYLVESPGFDGPPRPVEMRLCSLQEANSLLVLDPWVLLGVTSNVRGPQFVMGRLV